MKSGFSTLIFMLSFLTSFAGSCGEPVLQLGWFTATQGKSQHIDIEGLIGDDFSVKKSSDQNLLVGVGYYFDGLCTPQVDIQYGINAFYLAPTKVKGDVTQEDLFTNLSYHYSRTNYPIYVSAKALIPCCMNYDLDIDLGIGPNIINTSGFKEKSLDGGITIPDAHLFSGKNVVAFSATAGLGWRLNHVFGNLSLEIDYRFFYLGQGELKKVNGQVKNTLRTGTSYANALFFTISI
jgi:opacity protein-like surface antigen